MWASAGFLGKGRSEQSKMRLLKAMTRPLVRTLHMVARSSLPSIAACSNSVALGASAAVSARRRQPMASVVGMHVVRAGIGAQSGIGEQRVLLMGQATAGALAWSFSGMPRGCSAHASIAGCRAMSVDAGDEKDKVKHEGEPMFLSLPGSTDAHTVKVNKENRRIVGLEKTMDILAKDIGKEVPGVVSVRTTINTTNIVSHLTPLPSCDYVLTVPCYHIILHQPALHLSSLYRR